MPGSRETAVDGGRRLDHIGSHFTLDGARMPLKPLQKPHPPIWIAANSDAAVARAARLGYTWYVNPHATYETIKDQIELYQAGRSRSRDGSGALTSSHGTGTVHPRQIGRPHTRRLRHIWVASMKLTPDGGRMTPCLTTPSPSAFRELSRDRFIIGSPEDCIADLKRCVALGVDRLALRMVWPGMPLAKAMEVAAPLRRQGDARLHGVDPLRLWLCC